MSELRAVIEDPDGAIIARYYETPDKDHDFEIRPIIEEERIHEIGYKKQLTRSKIKNDVENFFESVGYSYGDNFTVDMK